jgi:glycerate kinase
MSKVLIAMDSFKGTLPATVACDIVAQAFSRFRPQITLSVKPVADGGEGTADVIVKACGGMFIQKTVTGPLMGMNVSAGFGLIDDDLTAIVEMANASGLVLLKKTQRDPLLTTTYGTGQLIRAARQKGVKHILLAVGGSATMDGGVGAARALGWRFLDGDGKDVPHGGGFLTSIQTIAPPPQSSEIPKMSVLCDVNNPLCGPTGAAHVYARQKGADDPMIELLEEGLSHLASLVKREIGVDIRDLPGAGAAGGLAAGAVAFMNGTLTSGLENVMECLNLSQEIEKADWVITGEGSFDHQSLCGKVVGVIAAESKKRNKKVGVIAGRVKLSEQACRQEGIETAIACAGADIDENYAAKHAQELLYKAAERFIEKMEIESQTQSS